MFRGIGLWLLGVPIWLIIIIVLFLRLFSLDCQMIS